MRRPVSVRVDMIQRHIYDLSDPVLVDVVHRETADTVRTEERLLRCIQVSQANVHARTYQDGL